MANIDFNTLLPHLFIGDWNVIRKRKGYAKIGSKVEDSYSPEVDKIIISLPSEAKRIEPTSVLTASLYKIESVDGVPTDQLIESKDLSYDSSNETLSYESGRDKIFISFWRHPSRDIIFALREEDPEMPGRDDVEVRWTTIWSAKRSAASSTCPRGLSGKTWNIVLGTGKHAAEGKVVLDRLCPKNATSKDLNLFGLFQIKGEEKTLYDILSYDGDVRSFNSVFSIRSLNWQQSQSSGDRIFATFNNTHSLPTSRIHSAPAPTVGVNHRIGYLMDFETLETDSFGDTDTDDPDIGIWVGDPLQDPPTP